MFTLPFTTRTTTGAAQSPTVGGTRSLSVGESNDSSYYTYELKNVLVSSYSVGGGAD